MTRRAFTLVELLVVIAIMVTLMSLIMGGVMLAKRSAMRAKATSLLGAVASAIDQYRSLNSVYPERLLVTAAMATATPSLAAFQDKEVYGELAFNLGSTIQAATAVTDNGWKAVNMALVYQLGDLVSDQAKSGLLIDPWETPLRYRPSRWYLYTGPANSFPRIDRTEPPGQDSYQLWSAGPSPSDAAGLADPGEGGDDIPQWAKSQ